MASGSVEAVKTKLKVLGSFATEAALGSLLDVELGSMYENTAQHIKVSATATVGVFVTSYAYTGVLYKGVGTDYSHVMLYQSGLRPVVTGARTPNGWTFDRFDFHKNIGTASTHAQLETILEAALADIPANHVRNIRFDATGTFDVFSNGVSYEGTIRRGSGDVYVPVFFQIMSNTDVLITGGKGADGWKFYISHFGTHGYAGIEAQGMTAPKAISTGKFVDWRGILYTAKSDIASGAALSTSNLQAVTDGGLNSLMGKSIVPCGTVPTNTALSTVTNPGFYFISSTNTYTDKPLTDCYGMLVMRGSMTGTVFQVTFGQQNICLRTISGSTISSWCRFIGTVIS